MAPALKGVGLTIAPFAIRHEAAWTPEALRKLFVAWVERNPGRRQDDQYVGVTDALHEAWPCR